MSSKKLWATYRVVVFRRENRSGIRKHSYYPPTGSLRRVRRRMEYIKNCVGYITSRGIIF